MPDSISQAAFYQAMQDMRDLIDARHSSLRHSMEEGNDRIEGKIDSLAKKLDAHIVDDHAVEKRVTRMETEQEIKARQAATRGTVVGAIAGMGFTGALEAMKHFWK